MFTRLAAFADRHFTLLLTIPFAFVLMRASVAGRAEDVAGVLATFPEMMLLCVLALVSSARVRITRDKVRPAPEIEPDIIDQIDALIRDHDARNVLIRASDLGALRLAVRDMGGALSEGHWNKIPPVYRLDGTQVTQPEITELYGWGDVCVLVERDEVRS
jgi:hypothetical protein